MTENQAMSDERLAELRETHGPWHYTEFGVLCSCGEAMDANEECPTLQLVSEIERLRAENERLRQAGIAALEYMDECECYWPDGSPDQGYIPISRPCPHALVQRALNPEPTS